MNNLNQYRLNKKISSIWKISWNLLIYFSKLVIFIFFLITAVIFWQNISIQFFKDYQINLAQPIAKMIFIVLLLTILVGIDILKKLKTK
jgi:hypothetical protein